MNTARQVKQPAKLEKWQIEQAKRGVNLIERAQQLGVELRKIARDEWAGPCPKCGGSDRFHVKEDGWFCSQCGPKGREFSDAIALEQWIRGCSFMEAYNILSGGVVPTTPAPAPRPAAPKPAKKSSTLWQTVDWQSTWGQRLEQAQDNLWNLDAGQPGREATEARGIRLDTAIMYGMGYADAWNIKAQKYMPALWLPWQNQNICAIQFRFIGVEKGDKTADRFGQAKGGDRILFGLQNSFNLPDWKPHTLIIVEGEMNCVSIAQSIRDTGLPVDVVSYGPEHNLSNPPTVKKLAEVAPGYRHCIVWADEPEIAMSALGNLPAGTLPIRSPGGLDANDLLQRGQLDDFIWKLIQKVDGA